MFKFNLVLIILISSLFSYSQMESGTYTDIGIALTEPLNVNILDLRNDQSVLELPKEMDIFENLQILNISGTKISVIPKSLGRCRNLIKIVANASKIEELPSSIKKLKKLEFVNISHTEIHSLPKKIGNCKSLKEIHCSDNKLEQLPNSIYKLENLTFLNIKGNELSLISEKIIGLESLIHFWIHDNNITLLPIEIASLKNLQNLLLDLCEIKNWDTLLDHLLLVTVVDECNP